MTDADRLDRILLSLKLLTAYAVVLTGAIVFLAFSERADRRAAHGVMYVRGIVIQDSTGRARILIGAPVPMVAGRVRTDTALVRRLWAPRFPPQYMGWYTTYHNAMTGMLVLNDSGFDRVAIGDSVPDPNIGRRIGPSTGIIVNDARGFERTGYGVLTVRGNDRAVLGLDSPGAEALTLSVIDSGPVGVRVQYQDRAMFIGGGPLDESASARAEPFFGIMERHGDGPEQKIDLTRLSYR